ncbi:hypothetical protein ACVBEF_20105, partial [Glaciimonas sp. GG7]
RPQMLLPCGFPNFPATRRELSEDMFERSELVLRPDGWLENLGTRRAAAFAVAFSLVTFFWRSKRK